MKFTAHNLFVVVFFYPKQPFAQNQACLVDAELILTEMMADKVSMAPVLRVMYGIMFWAKPASLRIPLV